ncbi:hypothetical protein [Rhizobium sp. FKY42]|uniref:hypothetical protein n=1 Tax=Rhizobium sp. FKY42 TaxID=2562310 RepID=UPI0010BFA256|nr:hypothetical protein [Rhizobium sp. FKY42]
MTGYQIALFVRPDVVTPEIRQAWQREGCELIVRSDYPPIEEAANQRYAGALLDIKLQASYLFDLSELLTLRAIPHVFVVTDEAQQSHYALNGGPDSIRMILDELLYQDDEGHRH